MPISFRIRLYPHENLYDENQNMVEVVKEFQESRNFFNFSCVMDSCLDSSRQETVVNDITTKLSYSKLNVYNLVENSVINLHTKKPHWNREVPYLYRKYFNYNTFQ